MNAVVAEGEEGHFASLGPEFAGGKALLFRSRAELPEPLQSLSEADLSTLVVPLKHADALFGAFALVAMAPNAFGEATLTWPQAWPTWRR